MSGDDILLDNFLAMCAATRCDARCRCGWYSAWRLVHVRRMRDTAVVRVSDDFYPRNPSSSHPHIAACAYNGLFLSAIAHVSPSLLRCLLYG